MSIPGDDEKTDGQEVPVTPPATDDDDTDDTDDDSGDDTDTDGPVDGTPTTGDTGKPTTGDDEPQPAPTPIFRDAVIIHDKKKA